MIECIDNLKFMQGLPSESIDLIYCDVLYGTGKKFADYQDLKANRKVIEDFYCPKIKEMHRLLKSTGGIYLQMDCKISHWVRLIMDDVFGYENFRNQIVWHYKGREKYSQNKFASKHDLILFYANPNHKINPIKKEWDKQERIKTMRRKILIDDEGKEYFVDNRGQANGVPKNKKYLDEYIDKGGALSDVWDDINSIRGTDRNKVNYDTQKPQALVERIVMTSSNVGGVVADFFLGSGTTAIVCKKLNRNFIGCDINPKAIKITNERLQASLF